MKKTLKRKDGRRCYVVHRYSIEEISHCQKGTVRDGTEQELPLLTVNRSIL